MDIEYERLEWEDYPSTATPINAENLNHLEEGIAGLYSDRYDMQSNIAYVDDGDTASKDYLPNSYLMNGGLFYKVTKTILYGDSFDSGEDGNIERVDIASQFSSGGGGSVNADDVSYNNTRSGLTATDVQGAVDEVNSNSIHQLAEMNYKVTPIASGTSHVTNITLDAPTGYKFLCVLRAITNEWIGTVNMPIISQTSTSEVIDLWLNPVTPNANCSVDVKYLVYK